MTGSTTSPPPRASIAKSAASPASDRRRPKAAEGSRSGFCNLDSGAEQQGKGGGRESDQCVEQEEGLTARQIGAQAPNQCSGGGSQRPGERIPPEGTVTLGGLHRLGEEGLLNGGKRAEVKGSCPQHAGDTRQREEPARRGQGEVEAGQNHAQTSPSHG